MVYIVIVFVGLALLHLIFESTVLPSVLFSLSCQLKEQEARLSTEFEEGRLPEDVYGPFRYFMLGLAENLSLLRLTLLTKMLMREGLSAPNPSPIQKALNSNDLPVLAEIRQRMAVITLKALVLNSGMLLLYLAVFILMMGVLIIPLLLGIKGFRAILIQLSQTFWVRLIPFIENRSQFSH